MNPMPYAKSLCRYMDSVMLSPSMTLGLSCYNKKSGKVSGPKSVTLSTQTTLFRMLLFLLGLMILFRTVYLFFCMKTKREMMKKMRKKMRRGRKK